MSDLWRRIERWVVSGTEARKVDLKRSLDLASRPSKTKLGQLVSAIANTQGGPGYIVIGVMDKKERTDGDWTAAICGIDEEPDRYSRQIQQALADTTNPIPPVRYETLIAPTTDKTLGVIVVEQSSQRPHELTRDSEGIERGIYLRRGAETFRATREELAALFGASPEPIMIVNFSHPLTAEQKREISAQADRYVSDVLDVPIHFRDDEPFAAQIAEAVSSVGLTEDEWQTLPIIVNPPGYAPIATALIADLHGRCGHFPTVLRLKRSAADATRYVFAEIMQLQQIRDESRRLR